MIDKDELLNIAITNIRKVLHFDPYKSYSDVNNRDEFKQLIANDPAFGILGLDDDRYIIARVGGNLITSLHRKLGDMYESLFVYLLTKSLTGGQVYEKACMKGFDQLVSPKDKKLFFK